MKILKKPKIKILTTCLLIMALAVIQLLQTETIKEEWKWSLFQDI